MQLSQAKKTRAETIHARFPDKGARATARHAKTASSHGKIRLAENAAFILQDNFPKQKKRAQNKIHARFPNKGARATARDAKAAPTHGKICLAENAAFIFPAAASAGFEVPCSS